MTNHNAIIVIPARYASTRFPGKPLAMLKGRPMLEHVVEKARLAVPDTDICVATDDPRIAECAEFLKVKTVMTDADLATGSDRVLAALKLIGSKADIVLNLQGDAPLMPALAIKAVLDALRTDPTVQVATPVKQLSWDALDKLVQDKKTTPFSGTTVTLDAQHNALWFSKTILPSIRKPDRSQPLSPVFQHLGLYGFRTSTLQKFVSLPEGVYERLEGLEQLRLLENHIPIRCVVLPPETLIHGGIDSAEDLSRAEGLL